MDPVRELAQVGEPGLQVARHLVDELEELGAAGLRGAAARELQHQRGGDEALLRSVVEISLQPPAGGVGRLDDARPGRPHLTRLRRLRLLPAQPLLGRPSLGDVEDHAVEARPAVLVEDRRPALEDASAPGRRPARSGTRS